MLKKELGCIRNSEHINYNEEVDIMQKMWHKQ